jgi:hypothetical protein
MIGDARYSELLRAARTQLAGFVQHDGTVAFPSPAHIAIATKA